MIFIQKSDQPGYKYTVNFPIFDEINAEQVQAIIKDKEDIQLDARRRGTMNRYSITAMVTAVNITAANIEFELPTDILNGEYEIILEQDGTTKGKTLLRIEERYSTHKQNNIDRIIKE